MIDKQELRNIVAYAKRKGYNARVADDDRGVVIQAVSGGGIIMGDESTVMSLAGARDLLED